MSLVICQWRHIKLLLRGGRAHDPDGIDTTTEGSLAVECAACPHPGRNLPDDWEDAPADRKYVLYIRFSLLCSLNTNRWLYTLYLMMDTNFRLKLKDCGVDDVYFGPGWAYMVEDSKFKEFLDVYAQDKIEVSFLVHDVRVVVHTIIFIPDQPLLCRAQGHLQGQQNPTWILSLRSRCGDVQQTRTRTPQWRRRSSKGREVSAAMYRYIRGSTNNF